MGLCFRLEMSLGRRWRAQNARLLAWVVPDRRFRARLPGRRPFGAGLIVTTAVTVVAAGTCWVVKRSADRAHGWAIRPVARCDTGEQETDRGAAQVVGRRAGGDLTARLAGDVEQEPGLPAVVPAPAGRTG